MCYRHVLKVVEEATKPTTVYDSNQACISWAPGERRRSRHINARHYVCREAVNIGEVELEYCAKMGMMADCVEKPLGPQKFKAVKD